MLKKDGVNLSDIVYGFGTASSYKGLSTSEVSPSYKKDGITYKAVRRDTVFMPYSNLTVTGFKESGSSIFGEANFEMAYVNRFISEGILRKTYTNQANAIIPVYYKGGGTFSSLGTLYMGDTSTVYLTNVPSVILVMGQAAGGNGGNSKRTQGFLGSVVGGGGGGGGGAFSCFQVSLPFQATSPELVFHISISGGEVHFYAPDGLNPFLTLFKGQIGEDGRGIIEGLSVISHTGRGGNGGTAWIRSKPSNFTFMNITTTNAVGSASPTAITGGQGGMGGGDSKAFGIVVNTFTSYGGSDVAHRYIYSMVDKVIPRTGTAKGGEASGRTGGGGGASVLSNGCKAGTGATASMYGAGGSGGYDGSGKAGGPACIQFVW